MSTYKSQFTGPQIDARLTLANTATQPGDAVDTLSETATAKIMTDAERDKLAGLGTAATVNTGTSGATIPLLNGANTWAAAQTLSVDATINGVRVGRGGGDINTNTAAGHQALHNNTTGHSNTATGREALQSNTTGVQNTATGFRALQNSTTGYSNTATGREALQNNTTGHSNTATGFWALQNNTTGHSNTATGLWAGRYAGSGTDANATSNNSLYLGYQTRASASGNVNEVVIGYNVVGAGSNTSTIGNSDTTLAKLFGNTLQLTSSRTPASATAAGAAGEICWDADFLYLCVAENVWRRIAHDTW